MSTEDRVPATAEALTETAAVESLSPAGMRERSGELRQAVKARQREAYELDRQADQAEWEAGLWELADAAEDALSDIRELTPGLEAAADDAVRAQRDADDRLRRVRAHLASAAGAEKRLQDRDADPELIDDAAVRVSSARRTIARAEEALTAAGQARQKAEAALTAHREAVSGAEGRYRQATASAAYPGIAPRTSPLRIGLGRPEDMTDDERKMFAGIAIALFAASDSRGTSQPQQPDPGQFRYVQQGGRLLAIPPARRT